MQGARFILNTRYFSIAKPGEQTSEYKLSREHVKRLVLYCGTRETVSLEVKPENMNLSVTLKQQETINELLQELQNKDGNEGKETFEYKDYLKAPTRQNASELISRLSEIILYGGNAKSIDEVENLIDYAANRPGVVRVGEHGLFSSFPNVDLEKAAEEISTHDGNIWTHILSLRREDADKLGYDSQQPWRDLVMSHIDDIAEAHEIKPENLRWYAAMHNTGHHPHIHLFVYSADPIDNEGLFNEKKNKSITKMKSAFANDIFKDDPYFAYAKEQKTEYRNELRKQSEKLINELLHGKNAGFSDDKIELLTNKMNELADLLPAKGKAVYGFMTDDKKQLVNEIQRIFVYDNPILSQLYQNWCAEQNNIVRLYINEPKFDYPIENNKDFIKIKNDIINAAKSLRDGTSKNTDFEYITKGSYEITQIDSVTTEANEKNIETNSNRGDFSSYDPVQIYMNKYPEQIFYSPEPENAELKQIFNSNLIFESDEYAVKNFKSLSILANDFSLRNGEICRKLADCYNFGNGTEKDFAQAVLWYGIAADEFKDSMASYRLGQIYLQGNEEIDKDIELGHFYSKNAFFGFLDEIKNKDFFDKLFQGIDEPDYEINVSKSDAYKEYLLGRLYLKGEGIEKNYFNAYKSLLLAAENGYTYANHNSMAEYGIGLTYLNGTDIYKDAEKAIVWFNKSMQNGNADAAFKLAQIFSTEEYGFFDKDKADIFYRYAAELGNAYANYHLGKQEFKNNNIKASIDYFEKAANGNISHAWYKLGQIYSNEELGAFDGEKAQECYNKALNQYISDYSNNPDDFTAYRIASMYMYGRGTTVNIPEAMSWFEKSYNFSNPDAAYQLGNIYHSDNYEFKNYNIAYQYYNFAFNSYMTEFEKSPTDGNIAMRIGTMYHYGLGVERDIEKALSWYRKAVELGNLKAQEKIDNAQNDKAISAMSIASTACHFGKIINTETQAVAKQRYASDHKLKRDEKLHKIAAGHAVSDNEQGYDY